MRILHLTDTHVRSRHAGGRDLALFLQRAKERFAADRAVITGDCTDHGCGSEFDALAKALADSPFPVDVTAGNHDRPPYEEFAARFGDGCWARDHGPVRLVGFPTPATDGSFTLPNERLEHALENGARKPVLLVFTHVPPLIPEGRYLGWGRGHSSKSAFRNHMCLTGRPLMHWLDLCSRFGVRASFHGHINMDHSCMCPVSGSQVHVTADFDRSFRLVEVDDANEVHSAVFGRNTEGHAMLLEPRPYMRGSEFKVFEQTPVRVNIFDPSVTSARLLAPSGDSFELKRADDVAWHGEWTPEPDRYGLTALRIAWTPGSGCERLAAWRILRSRRPANRG